MKFVVVIAQIIVSVLLMVLILLQSSKGGLSSFGGELYRTKRGAERIVFTGTIICTIAFLITSILNLIVQ